MKANGMNTSCFTVSVLFVFVLVLGAVLYQPTKAVATDEVFALNPIKIKKDSWNPDKLTSLWQRGLLSNK